MNPNDKTEALKIGWTPSTSTYLYKSKWFNLRSDKIQIENGKEFTYTFVEHPGSVTVVPLTESNDIILIRSFRYTTDRWTWEVPAGGLGDKPGVTVESIAREELREEIGGEAKHFLKLGTFDLANGIANMPVHLFLATGVRLTSPQTLESGEKIDQIRTVPFLEALQMVYRGEILDGNSALGILMAQNHLATVKGTAQ